jgi:ribA/ribD-fused uncharacterized protein
MEKVVYNGKLAIVFKIKDTFGGMSNMSPLPIVVDGIEFNSSEALYQACKYPAHPQIQESIIKARTPMDSKKVQANSLCHIRTDWDDVRVGVMRWALKIKYIQNSAYFQQLLDSTMDLKIVEKSSRDDFWGAIQCDSCLIGHNILGRLLMEMRRSTRLKTMTEITPLKIRDFTMLSKQIPTIIQETPLSLF